MDSVFYSSFAWDAPCILCLRDRAKKSLDEYSDQTVAQCAVLSLNKSRLYRFLTVTSTFCGKVRFARPRNRTDDEFHGARADFLPLVGVLNISRLSFTLSA